MQAREIKKVPLVKDFLDDFLLVKKCQTTETLVAALSDLKSSHDVVLVYEGDEFVGILSPHQSLYKHRFPGKTKVHKAMFRSMKIEGETPLYLVAEYMVATRIYTLPVFKESVVVGIITSDSILKLLNVNKGLFREIEDRIKLNEPVSVGVDESMTKVTELMRKYQVSRVLVSDKKGKFIGAVTRAKVAPILLLPLREREQTFDREKVALKDELVRSYLEKAVISATPSATIPALLSKIVRSGIHSIVVGKGGRASGVLSRYDFLKAFAELSPKSSVPVILQSGASDLEEEMYQKLAVFEVGQFVEKISRRAPVSRIELKFKLIKNPVGKTRIYEARIKLYLIGKQDFFVEASGYRLDEAVRASLAKLEKRLSSIL